MNKTGINRRAFLAAATSGAMTLTRTAAAPRGAGVVQRRVSPNEKLNIACIGAGGKGVSDDTPLAYFYAWARSLRIVDGPDAVHLRSIAREELRRERPFTG